MEATLSYETRVPNEALHDVITQNTAICNIAAMKTSNFIGIS
jgi:hypothetical protein